MGERVATHPDIRGLVSIGSVENGTRVNVAAAASLKKVTMELGGKSPSIVFDDADLAAAAAGTTFGVFYNSGQACVASTRLLVQESIADEFVQQLTRIAEGLRVGAPATDPQLGPLATNAQYRRVIGYLETATSGGSQVAVGGGRPAEAGNRGYYVAPKILTDVARRCASAARRSSGRSCRCSRSPTSRRR